MSSSRRAFVRGQWNSVSTEEHPRLPHAEIVSLIVSAWPQHLDEVSQAILAIPNAEIHASDPKGKLIVVLEEARPLDVLCVTFSRTLYCAISEICPRQYGDI